MDPHEIDGLLIVVLTESNTPEWKNALRNKSFAKRFCWDGCGLKQGDEDGQASKESDVLCFEWETTCLILVREDEVRSLPELTHYLLDRFPQPHTYMAVHSMPAYLRNEQPSLKRRVRHLVDFHHIDSFNFFTTPLEHLLKDVSDSDCRQHLMALSAAILQIAGMSSTSRISILKHRIGAILTPLAIDLHGLEDTVVAERLRYAEEIRLDYKHRTFVHLLADIRFLVTGAGRVGIETSSLQREVLPLGYFIIDLARKEGAEDSSIGVVLDLCGLGPEVLDNKCTIEQFFLDLDGASAEGASALCDKLIGSDRAHITYHGQLHGYGEWLNLLMAAINRLRAEIERPRNLL